jgi:hypothetical protein
VPRFPGFIGPTYQAGSLALDAQRSVNLYVENDESGAGKSPAALLGTPGLSVFTTLPTSPVRGLLAGGAPLSSGGILWAVAGSRLYDVASGGLYADRGDVGNDGKPVQMFVNGNQLMIISAGACWIDNGAGPVRATFISDSGVLDVAGTALTWVSGDLFNVGMVAHTIYLGATPYTVASYTDSTHITLTASAGAGTGVAYYTANDNIDATTGAFLDGYFIIQKPASKQFNISANNNGLSWNPIDFAIKEAYPDNIGALLTSHEDLWVFGEETTQVYRNTGAAAFPLETDPGAMIHQGISAPYSAIRFNNGVAWLGGDSRGAPVAWAAVGYTPTRVSTHAVEAAWQAYSSVSDAVSYAYEDQGHQFWVISFPTGGATWAYDATTKLWHERAYWTGSAFARQRQQNHAYVFGKHLVGDYATGVVYQMSSSTFTDNGTTIRRVRTAPHISDGDDWLFHSRLRLDIENTGAVNPSLDWSVDGGNTYNTPRTTTSQAAGAFARYDFRRLGRSRDRVYRVTITAAVKVAIVDAFLDVIPGTKP